MESNWKNMMTPQEWLDKTTPPNDIPLLQDLLDDLRDNKIELPQLKDKCWFVYYPTVKHREEGKRWYAPYPELMALAEFRAHELDSMTRMMWMSKEEIFEKYGDQLSDEQRNELNNE